MTRNAGKDVYTLIREIKLPEHLNVGEGYGKLTWSIRGTYEGYAGWFDLKPATMYEAPPSSPCADAELVKLAGGPDPVVARAVEVLKKGQAPGALRLTDAGARGRRFSSRRMRGSNEGARISTGSIAEFE